MASLLLETRDYAKEKLAAVTPIVGYKEDGWLTEGYMEKIYSGMADMSADRYFENVLNAMRFWTKKAFSDLDRMPVEYMTVQSKGFDTTEVSSTLRLEFISLGTFEFAPAGGTPRILIFKT